MWAVIPTRRRERHTKNMGSERWWQCLLPDLDCRLTSPRSKILNSWTTDDGGLKGDTGSTLRLSRGERTIQLCPVNCLRLMSLSYSLPAVALSSVVRVRVTARYPPINHLILHYLHRLYASNYLIGTLAAYTNDQTSRPSDQQPRTAVNARIGVIDRVIPLHWRPATYQPITLVTTRRRLKRRAFEFWNRSLKLNLHRL